MQHPLIFITLFEDVGTSGAGSTNIGTLGDAGNFETDSSGWGFSFAPDGNRSTEQFFKDDYSFKWILPVAMGSPSAYTIADQAFPGVNGTTYTAKARVRCDSAAFPSDNPALSYFRIDPAAGDVTAVTYTTKTVNDCNGSWQEITTQFTQGPTLDILRLTFYRNGAIAIDGNHVYVDAFEVYENEVITYHQGDRILVYWDDVTETRRVYHEVNPGATVSEITVDPGLSLRLRRGYVEYISWVDIGRPDVSGPDGGASAFIGDSATFTKSDYQFCDGDDLWNFYTEPDYPSFPYSDIVVTPNHVACVVPDIVCDIHITGIVVTHPTTPTSVDGEIHATAVSSHGAVRYSLDNVLYDEMTNTTGIFTGLAGAVTLLVWARDPYNCVSSDYVTLYPGTISGDNIKYRGEFLAQQTELTHRIDIIQSDFSGSITEVIMGDIPIELNKPLSNDYDKFPLLNPTSATINLVSLKNFQYFNLFTQNDRKYLVNYYIDDVLNWRGYILPSVFSEPYEAIPYVTSIIATDNIEELSKTEYRDDSGNRIFGSQSIIKIVAFILKKLDLDLNIRVAMNVYEITQDQTATDDPLAQTYIDQETFFDEDGTTWDCARVLECILKPFLPMLVQSNGYWWIVRNEERRAAFDYREFDVDGDYVSNGSYDPIINITDPSAIFREVLFANQDHILSVIPAYGKINIAHSLIAKSTLIKSGNFNLDDWDTNLQFFRGWGHDLTEGSGISIKQAKLITRNSRSRLNFSAKGVNGQPFQVITTVAEATDNYAMEITNIQSGKHVYVFTELQPMEHITNDAFNFSFDYRINLGITDDGFASGRPVDPLWIKMRYKIQKGNYYYNAKTGWTTDTGQSYNDVWIPREDFDKTNTIEVKGRFRDVTSIADEQFRLTFEFQASVFYDFVGPDADNATVTLRAIPTEDLPTGYKIFGIGKFKYGSGDPDANTITRRYYELINYAAASDDGVDLIIPDDYDGSDNACVWKLYYPDTANPDLGYRGSIKNIQQIYLDSVDFDFLPNSTLVPETENINILNNADYKEVLDFEIESGDLPDFVISNAKNIYLNYFRDSNGVPLTKWQRDGSGELNTIQTILAKILTAQYRAPSFKISGSFVNLIGLGWLNTLKQVQPAIDVEFTNDEFTGSLAGWNNGSGSHPWTYNTNTAEMSLIGQSANSNILYQAVTISAGQRIKLEFSIEASGIVASEGFGDDFTIVGMMDNDILQEEVMASFTFDNVRNGTLEFTLMQDINRLGFRIRNQNNSVRTAGYIVYKLILSGVEVIKYFMPNALTLDTRHSMSTATLVELSQIADSSGVVGADFSGAYSSAYGGSFNTLLQ